MKLGSVSPHQPHLLALLQLRGVEVAVLWIWQLYTSSQIYKSFLPVYDVIYFVQVLLALSTLGSLDLNSG